MAVRPYISILIDGQEAELKEPMELHLTYAHIDLHNPTVVKNGFSKTIVFDGTPTNNRIFGCFGNMDRMIATEDGKNTGAYYDPSRKVDVVIMRNYEILDRGYIKLDKVVKKGNNVEYHTTFYSGLGQFLYGLSYKDDGEQMKLSDLEYDYNIDIEVTKDTVRNAWDRINKIDLWQDDDLNIYDFINFAPCYNGIPENFSADKVAIDANNLPVGFFSQSDVEKGDYKTVNGWMLGELNKEYDEWQMKDLRSYLQRPVIRFKEIISACCNPENNGGYTVDLDEEFFNKDNPYYHDAWMTLPLLNEIEIPENVKVPEASFAVSNNEITVNGCEVNSTYNISLPFSLNIIVDDSSSDVLSSSAYFHCSGKYDTGNSKGTASASLSDYGGVYYVQMVAYDFNDEPVAGSQIMVFGGTLLNPSSNLEAVYDFQPEVMTNYEKRFALWYKQEDSTYKFEDAEHTLTINNLTYMDGMYFKVIVKRAKNIYDENDNGGLISTFYPQTSYVWEATGNVNSNDCSILVSEKRDEVQVNGQAIAEIDTNGLVEESYNRLKKRFVKKTLLNSEHSPCDYFLGYLKMFNLHIWNDNVEKKVYVRQRKNYFTGNKVDIDNMVDRNSEITVTPIVYDAKWYNFGVEYSDETHLNKLYKDTYGIDYGIQKVNTNYNYDSSSKDLLEKIVFKGVICNRGKSKYYVDIYQDNYGSYPMPSFVMDGCQTFLYNSSGDTVEGKYITPKTSAVSKIWWKTLYYDIAPKPDFRDKDGKGVDGANVLLFHNGTVELKDEDGKYMRFKLTDDIPEFEQLNEGEPCWIWTAYSYAFKDVINLPVFSRYKTNENGWVTHSWDFGTPKEVFVPDYTIDNSSDIYTQYWKPYIQDEYDKNTRQAEVKIRYKGRVSPDMLMDFVYFDGCYWRIAEIKDYNPCSQETTKTTLVKVQDMNNFLI